MPTVCEGSSISAARCSYVPGSITSCWSTASAWRAPRPWCCASGSRCPVAHRDAERLCEHVESLEDGAGAREMRDFAPSGHGDPDVAGLDVHGDVARLGKVA